MFTLADLIIPIMAAPMAGGPSTPELVAAVANAGGTGYLAAGYKPVDALAEEIARLRTLTSGPFGVNLFVPADDVSRDEETAGKLSDYRNALDQEAQRYGCEIPVPDPRDRDGWEEKIAFLIDNPVPFVSFTFGCPDTETISRLQNAGTFVVDTVSDEDEARTAEERGADALCVQGPDAGGHRGTHSVDKVPDERNLDALLRGVRAVTDLPMIAAGGITRAEQISAALNAGAVAVQLGTVLLRAPESGASDPHKEALASGAFSATRTTRAFSGRWARGLENRFLSTHHAEAPPAYPELNQMTRPLWKAAAAAGDADCMPLWAGTGFRDAEARPAADIVTALWRGAGR